MISILNQIRIVFLTYEKVIEENDIWITDLGCPHWPPKKRPDNISSVYIFMYGDITLKVGLADINSTARYNSHHYTPGGSNSSLYNSLKNDDELMSIIGKEDIGKWIKRNCRRIDIHLSDKMDSFELKLIEALMINRLQPLYEKYIEREYSIKNDD